MEQFLPAIIISVIVVVIMVKQIGQITGRIDAKGELSDTTLYAKFASIVQEKIREIKKDIDTSKETPEPVYVLTSEEKEEKALEELSDMIRKLVFFETMNAKNGSREKIEKEMFAVLSELDSFLNQAVKEGEVLADTLREELFAEYERLQRA
jgi:valyl-tRNA synthetase